MSPLSTNRRVYVVLLINAFVLLGAIGTTIYVLRTSSFSNCHQIQQIKDSERTLWERAIRRSPRADPQQVKAFKHDLFELFPPHGC